MEKVNVGRIDDAFFGIARVSVRGVAVVFYQFLALVFCVCTTVVTLFA